MSQNRTVSWRRSSCSAFSDAGIVSAECLEVMEFGERGSKTVSLVRKASIAFRIVLRGPSGSPRSFKSPSLSSGKLSGVSSSRSNA